MTWQESFALVRMAVWVVLAVVAFTILPNLKSSLPIIFLMSAYANFMTDYSVFSGQGAKRAAQEEEGEA